MTRFLANENSPKASVKLLRTAGVDITWMRDVAQGATDPMVMERAKREQRVILTFDHDYGDLVFRRQLIPPGAVRFRIADLIDLVEPANIVLRLLASSSLELSGHFIVASHASIRVTPLPTLKREQ